MKKRATLQHPYLLVLLLGAPLCAADIAMPVGDGQAGQVVAALHKTLVDVMQNADELGYQGRYDKLAPVITQGFDTPFIARTILSRYWRELDEMQRSEFIALFNRLSVTTYAARFSGYDGEGFQEVSQTPLKKGRLLVKTRLLRPGREHLSLDYLLHEKEGAWYIIGVIANGVNDLALKRAEYAFVMKEKGYNGLIQDITMQIQDLKANATTSN